MKKKKRKQILHLLILFSLFLIACNIEEILHEYNIYLSPVSRKESSKNNIEQESGSEEKEAIITDKKEDVDVCNATDYLDIDYVQTMNEVKEDGTWLCNYTVKVHNQNPSNNIWVLIFVYAEDGYQNTKGESWGMGDLVFPNVIYEWKYGRASTHDGDDDFQGPSMNVAKKIAGVFDGEECRHYYTNGLDDDYLEKIAIDIDNGCKIE